MFKCSQFLLGLFISLLLAGWYTGYGMYVWENDPTYISFGIIVFALTSYIVAFYNSEWAWMAQGLCMRFGLVGTGLGFLMMLVGVGNVDDFWLVISGASGAIITTVTGIVCSTFLMLHGWFMGMRD